jgi:hypothetical protein
VIICDLCGEEITNAEDGNYEWREEDANHSEAEIYFTHKRCCHTFEERNGGWLAPILCTRRCESRINRYRRVLGPA